MTDGRSSSPAEAIDLTAARSPVSGDGDRPLSRMGATLRLRLFALLNLPMLSLARPKVLLWDEQRAIIALPFCRRNRSFRGSMAFGPMMMAAECAAGFLFGADIHARKRRLGWLVTQCEASFVRAMRSEGRFEVCLAEPVSTLLDSVMQHNEPRDFSIEVLGRDSAGELCGRYHFTLRIQPSRARQ